MITPITDQIRDLLNRIEPGTRDAQLGSVLQDLQNAVATLQEAPAPTPGGSYTPLAYTGTPVYENEAYDNTGVAVDVSGVVAAGAKGAYLLVVLSATVLDGEAVTWAPNFQTAVPNIVQASIGPSPNSGTAAQFIMPLIAPLTEEGTVNFQCNSPAVSVVAGFSVQILALGYFT